jgi:hypothetical protein
LTKEENNRNIIFLCTILNYKRNKQQWFGCHFKLFYIFCAILMWSFWKQFIFCFFLNMILFHWKILNIITRVTIQNFIFGWKKNSQNFDISKFLKITEFLGKRYILYYKYHKLMAWKTDISGEFFKKNSNVGVFLLLFSIVVNLKSSQPWILKLKGIFIC